MKKKLATLFSDFLEDMFILFGMLLITASVFMLFGAAHAVFVFGVFMILIGMVDFHAFKNKDGDH